MSCKYQLKMRTDKFPKDVSIELCSCSGDYHNVCGYFERFKHRHGVKIAGTDCFGYCHEANL